MPPVEGGKFNLSKKRGRCLKEVSSLKFFLVFVFLQNLGSHSLD